MEILELIERIGAYAGFAALIGLAVLSALYFSQARDLKRLRAWAGRAPERAAEDAGPGEADRPPVRPAPAARPAPSASTSPAGAAAAGSGAAAAASGAAPAAAAESAASGDAVREGPPPAPTIVVPGGAVSAPVRGADAGAGSDRQGVSGAANGHGGDTAERRPVPSLPRGPVGPPLPSRADQRRLAPPPSAATGRPPWYRRVRPAYLALIVAGLLIGAGAAAYAVGELSGREAAPRAGGETTAAPAPSAREDGSAGPAEPAEVTFSVLNGTSVDGLAKQVADQLESEGYRRGNVTNATEQGSAESAVLYAPGARPEAQAVARELGMDQIEQIDPGSRALAGDATVVVVVGADQTR